MSWWTWPVYCLHHEKMTLHLPFKNRPFTLLKLNKVCQLSWRCYNTHIYSLYPQRLPQDSGRANSPQNNNVEDWKSVLAIHGLKYIYSCRLVCRSVPFLSAHSLLHPFCGQAKPLQHRVRTRHRLSGTSEHRSPIQRSVNPDDVSVGGF